MRLRIVSASMLLAQVFLALLFWRLQGMQASRYEESVARQSIRAMRLPGARGRVFDRHGVVLADNRPSFCIAVYAEELRQPGRLSRTIDRIEEVLRRVSRVIHMPCTLTRDHIARHLEKRRPLELLAWKDVHYESLSRFAESRLTFEGVGIYVEPIRTYPQGCLAAHVLGYVGRRDPAQYREESESYHYYLPEMEGRDGIEKVMNAALLGRAGGRLVRVDAAGYRREDLGGIEPTPGQDVVLALDARIQKLAEACLGTNKGAVVVLDPRNGDVLALASSPTYDPNMFSPSLDPHTWEQIRRDARKVLLNRAVAGVYPPGSVFKPIVMLAALRYGSAAAASSYICTGAFSIGDVTFRCWRQSGHGPLDMVTALEQSCNPYFCHLGLLCGHERIFFTAQSLGLGARSGIALPFEEAGVLPNDAWKRRLFHDAWRPGDTCNLSIGQGMLGVTPLQIAVAMAALANGGRVYRPRLVLGSWPSSAEPFPDQRRPPPVFPAGTPSGELVADLAWVRDASPLMRQALCQVVNAENGTGKRARLRRVTVAGKTGTAEYGKKTEDRRHTWMVAFAPAENPVCLAVILIEDGESGGRTAAPRMRALLSGILGIDEPEPGVESAFPGEAEW